MKRHSTFGLNWLFSEPPTYLWGAALPMEFISSIYTCKNTLYACIGSGEIRGSIGALRSQPISDEHIHTHTVGIPKKMANFFIFCRFYDNPPPLCRPIFEMEIIWKKIRMHWDPFIPVAPGLVRRDLIIGCWIFMNITWQSYPLFTRKSYLMKNDAFFSISAAID